MIQFPYFETEDYSSDGIPSAKGCYINYIEVGNLIILPKFNVPDSDKRAVEIIKEHMPKKNIETIDCEDLALEGGVLNCITWNNLH